MKKIELLFLLFFALLMANCKKNDPKVFEEKPAVYFSAFSATDSLVKSLVTSKTANDTVFVRVQLLGNVMPQDKTFKLMVDAKYTTAIEGTHYEKLKDTYVLPANQFSVNIPIVLYKTDPELTKKSFRIGVQIISSDNLDAGYVNRLNARIIFTNQLVKPSYWDSYLSIYYGAYSIVKHAKAVQVQQFDFPPTKPVNPELAVMQPKFQSYGRVLCTFYTENIVNDESGNRIVPWAAF